MLSFITTLRTTSEKRVPAAKNRVKQLHKACEKLLKQWKSTVASQVKAYNQRHKPKTYNKSNLVLLSMKNLSQKRLNKKLSHKFAESFHIQDIVESKHIAYIYLLTTEFIMFSCLIPWTLQSMSKWWDNAGVTLFKTDQWERRIQSWGNSKKAEKVSCDIRLNE
jgi:hypothetical protein